MNKPNRNSPDLSSVNQDFERDYFAWQTRMNDGIGQAFDPTLLVQLAQEQWSNMPQLALAFTRCRAQWPDGRGDIYTSFMAPLHKAERWSFFGNLFLQHPEWGTLIVDVIQDPETPGGLGIGGIEFMDRAKAEQDQLLAAYWPQGIGLHEEGEEVDVDEEPYPQMRIVHVASKR